MTVAKMSRRKISWSELPPELLSIIAGILQRRSDILNFRSVCQSWRNSAPFSLLNGINTILSPILPQKFSINLHVDLSKPGNWLIANQPLVLVATSVFVIKSIVNPNFPPWLVSVEEYESGKLFIRKNLSRKSYERLPENFSKNLSLPCFRVSEISRLYSLSIGGDEDNLRYHKKDRFSYKYKKVILYVDSDDKFETESTFTGGPIRIDDCALMVLLDSSSDGSIAKISLKDWKTSNVSSKGVKTFDDMVCFKGKFFVIDRKGRLYREENGDLGRPLAGSEPVGEGLGTDRQKRLVVDSSGGELYLVHRCPRYMGVAFKVYKLNEGIEGEMKWVELKGIGYDRILVATQDGCFFVPTKDIPTWGGNCLVFGKGVFPAYNNASAADAEIFKTPEGRMPDIAVFHFGIAECKPINNSYAKVLWPPPAWLSSDAHSSKWGSQKDEEVEGDSPAQNSTESSGNEESCSTPGFQGDTQANERLSSADIQENLYVEGSTPEITRCDFAITRCNNGTRKSLESGVSKMKFQGVNVSSDLVPTLKDIWAKHGNILEGHPVQSNDLAAWVLESIAKVVVLLQNTSGRSLNNSQAEYLSSTLFDLQLMRVNVSWLVSSAAKALNLHKGMANRAELEGTLKEIDKVTIQVAEMKSKFLAELGGLEKMLDVQRKKVCESLSGKSLAEE